jgi:hypothetical protein
MPQYRDVNCAKVIISWVHTFCTWNISSYSYVYHPCFKCTTYVCKMYKLTKEWFSFDFHYEDCGMGCLWWLYHIIIMNMLKLFKKLLLKEHMLMQKNDYGKMPLRSECGNNTMELFQYCSWYSISFLFLLILFFVS